MSNLSLQNNSKPGYSIVTRALVYASRMISQQYNKELDGKSYDGLKKVYTIWIIPQSAKEMAGVINGYFIKEEKLQGLYSNEVEK